MSVQAEPRRSQQAVFSLGPAGRTWNPPAAVSAESVWCCCGCDQQTQQLYWVCSLPSTFPVCVCVWLQSLCLWVSNNSIFTRNTLQVDAVAPAVCVLRYVPPQSLLFLKGTLSVVCHWDMSHSLRASCFSQETQLSRCALSIHGGKKKNQGRWYSARQLGQDTERDDKTFSVILGKKEKTENLMTKWGIVSTQRETRKWAWSLGAHL